MKRAYSSALFLYSLKGKDSYMVKLVLIRKGNHYEIGINHYDFGYNHYETPVNHYDFPTIHYENTRNRYFFH